jgi:2-oxo-4-hydroxy-4-carboxy-5-ureidoimidazoline decarboxylase
MKLNNLSVPKLQDALFACCGSLVWVRKMLAIFPVKDEEHLLSAATLYWYECAPADWLEAFNHHPKIGAATDNNKWAAEEQSSVAHTTDNILYRLEEGNRLYQEKFGYIFIVCATGKSAEEMLALLTERLPHTPSEEIKIAMEEQNKITHIRLKKLL